jgi:Spy/CpxP family protein refolding chaperone
MLKKSIYLLLIGSVLAIPTISFATTFPCDQSQLCAIAPIASPSEKPENIEYKLLSTTDLIKNLSLTAEQSLVVYHVVQAQMAEVNQTLQKLNNAQAILRNMAVSKQYDESMATMLVQIIADNTANLAILQVKRDYEMLSMLTPEQVKRYQALTTEHNF